MPYRGARNKRLYLPEATTILSAQSGVKGICTVVYTRGFEAKPHKKDRRERIPLPTITHHRAIPSWRSYPLLPLNHTHYRQERASLSALYRTLLQIIVGQLQILLGKRLPLGKVQSRRLAQQFRILPNNSPLPAAWQLGGQVHLIINQHIHIDASRASITQKDDERRFVAA